MPQPDPTTPADTTNVGHDIGYDTTGSADEEVENDPRVSTIPLDSEDGGTVVISQQVVGSENEIGGGEFPDAELEKPIVKAAAEQARLEREAPTH
jgi:hypothetical protein